MRKMKKVIIGIILLGIIAVVVGEPIMAGKVVEENFDKAMNEIRKTALIEVVEHKYEKGLMGGKATTVLRMVGGSSRDNFTLNHDISTVPFFTLNNGDSGTGFARIRTTLEIADKRTLEQLKKIFPEAMPSVDTVIGFNNSASMHFHVPSINFTEETKTYSDKLKKTTILSSGVNASIKVGSNGDDINGSLEMASFRVTEDMGSSSRNMEFKIDNVKSNIDLGRMTKNLYSGDASFKVGLIDIKIASMPVTIKDSELSYKLIDKKETYDYEFTMAIGNISSPAPLPIPVNQFKSVFTLQNLDTQATETIAQAYQDAIEKGGKVDDPMMAQMLMMQMMTLGESFLKRDIAASEKISVNGEKGAGNVDLNVNFKALEANMSLQSPEVMATLPQRISANLSVKLPKAIIAQTPLALQMDNFIQANYVVEEGDFYISKADFKDLKLTVNGKDVPLPMFQ